MSSYLFPKSVIQEILMLNKDQPAAFTADFESRLPEYLRNELHPEAAMV